MKKILTAFLISFIFFPSFAQKIEAEFGACSGARAGIDSVLFFSITKGSVEINFKIKKKGDYLIKMNYSITEGTDAAVQIDVDGVYFASQKLLSQNQVSSVYINNAATLKKGDHSIKVTGYRGDWACDSIELVEATEELINGIKPSRILCTKNPAPEAQAVFDYLLSMQGKGILSGQQIYGSNTMEIKTVFNTVGKYPAVLGIDLIDFSPSRVARGTSGGRTIQVAKKYWDEGGLVTCSWHWNAPFGLYDKDVPEMRWYDGFRTKASNFDFSKGIADHESEEYKAIINDIDAIAKQLKILQKENVPVLWRPLHEASGGWFWWGSKGAANYIELYKIVYDRLVNYHGLNNLIWVWNGQSPEWYPGDEYADIISYDYYPQKYRHTTATDLLALIQSSTALPKLCTLSENGALPNVVRMEQEKTPWSWWCTWNGDFVVAADGRTYSETNTKLDAFKLYYENPYTITRDELPSFKQ